MPEGRLNFNARRVDSQFDDFQILHAAHGFIVAVPRLKSASISAN
jgi:hypothetical protein